MNPHRINHLLTPAKLGSLSLGHRIIQVSDAGAWNPASSGKFPLPLTEPHVARATPGGLMICAVTPARVRGAQRSSRQGIHSAAQVNSWKGITREIHARGALAVACIGDTATSVRTLPNADEIDEALDIYRMAAENAGDAGFDGAELICADGSLPERLLDASAQIASTISHQLDPNDGPDILVAAVQSLFAAWPAHRIGLNLSYPRNLEQLALVGRALRSVDGLDLAYAHLGSLPIGPALKVDIVSAQLRPLFKGGLIASGHWTAPAAETAIRAGEIDAVGDHESHSGAPDLHDVLCRDFRVGP